MVKQMPQFGSRANERAAEMQDNVERQYRKLRRPVVDAETGELVEGYEQVDLEDFIKEQFPGDPGRGKAVLDARGHEILSPTQFALPLNARRSPSMFDQMRQMIRDERQALLDMQPETPDEADDFEIEDDPAPVSKWENDQEPSIKELRRIAQEKGYVYNRRTGQYELPTPPEDSHPKGRSEAEEPRKGLDDLEEAPPLKKPRGGSPAASEAPSTSDSDGV